MTDNLRAALDAWRRYSKKLRDEVCRDVSAKGIASYGSDAVAHHAALALLRAAGEPYPPCYCDDPETQLACPLHGSMSR